MARMTLTIVMIIRMMTMLMMTRRRRRTTTMTTTVSTAAAESGPSFAGARRDRAAADQTFEGSGGPAADWPGAARGREFKWRARSRQAFAF